MSAKANRSTMLCFCWYLFFALLISLFNLFPAPSKTRLEEEKAHDEAKNLLILALTSITEDILAKILPQDSRGRRAIASAEEVADKRDEPIFVEMALFLHENIWPAVVEAHKMKLPSNCQYRMMQDFHQVCISTEIDEQYQSILHRMEISNRDRLLKTKILNLYLRHLCCHVTPPASSTKTVTSNMTRDEEMALRYVAGFIPFSITKQYNRYKHSKYEVMGRCLRLWKGTNELDNVESEEQYTNAWTEKVNRGGLFVIKESV
ncbi:unnamed protein product, partial [Owenia fusiformis]